MMFLRAKDAIINLNAVQYIRRVQNTVTLYFENDFYDISFEREDEATDYFCGLSSMLDAKKSGGAR
ncbi:hypothetical protein EOM81_08175 [bacterium]|nr:hypothetical protein [bacterium]